MTIRPKTVAKKAPAELPEGLEPKASYTKGARVETIEDKNTKRKGDVRLDKTRMTFYAELGDGETYQAVQSKDGNAVKRWLREQLAKTTTAERLDWRPVIEVSVKAERRGYGEKYEMEAALALTVSRYYLALTVDKSEWRKLEWVQADPDSAAALDVDDRFTASKHFRDGPGAKTSPHVHGSDRRFTLPYFSTSSYHDDGATSYLLYTRELWDGLRVIEKTIKAQKKTLDAMLRTKDGIASVIALGNGTGQLRLTAGE